MKACPNDPVPPVIKIVELSNIFFDFTNRLYYKRYKALIKIKHLYDEEGFGYRKISKWLNKMKLRPLGARNGSILPLFQS